MGDPGWKTFKPVSRMFAKSRICWLIVGLNVLQLGPGADRFTSSCADHSTPVADAAFSLKVRLLGRYLNCDPETAKVRRLIERAQSEHVERQHATRPTSPARLTAVQNAEIVRLYEVGRKPADIARELGTTEWTVHHRLNRNGIVRRPTGLTPTEAQEAVRLNDAGVPISELCRRFGRSWKTVAKELRLARDQSRGS